ncbi:hypothetical protein PHYSODRAFT_320593 [Phytophthora sojae]|uniref:Uncharacterized protein n=1 Tax=Phytophthora sojae (strain P6497) TaxID=1094619 RepID=G4YLR4_PHYSP|nr:hypothetical protein PHYSODRAFT_320593 [Phytophthora sojae]EGZ26684.1 hypothetical protein PHYSODRAFT_320593 [Phytophthora sojae]|eukprot:XP_009513959.1 hypothetical protein PHYSODRAFT_320593 [Phytophthora sojae]
METTEAGMTAFALPPAPRYRFLITVTADKVQLMLEDCKSKMQATGFLEQNEYLTRTNTIPNASVNDYVKIFKGALDYLPGD